MIDLLTLPLSTRMMKSGVLVTLKCCCVLNMSGFRHLIIDSGAKMNILLYVICSSSFLTVRVLSKIFKIVAAYWLYLWRAAAKSLLEYVYDLILYGCMIF